MQAFEGFTELRTLRLKSAQGGRRLAWSSDGTLLAVTESPLVHLWDVTSGEIVRSLTGEYEVDAVCFAPGGDLIATAGGPIQARHQFLRDGVIQLRDVRTGRLVASRDTWYPTSLAFNAVGDRLASTRRNGFDVWKTDTNPLLHQLAAARGGPFWDIAFGMHGTVVAAGKEGTVVQTAPRAPMTRVANASNAVAVHPAGHMMATAVGRSAVELRGLDIGPALIRLEGHAGPVYKMSFAAGGRLLLTLAGDNCIRFWSTETWKCVHVIRLPPNGARRYIFAVHPELPLLAVARRNDLGADVHVWQYEPDGLLSQRRVQSVAYTTAKVVLVGDSGVGKTGLGYRLAHGEFKDHPSTHGQQFWLVDELGATRADGTHCEAILWDLAGQPDYRLTHALFVDDADLALVLFDATRDDTPLRGVEYWLRHLGGRPTILVAARADRGRARLSPQEIEQFCAQAGVRACVTTSALTGEGLADLVAHMRAAIAWDRSPTTITTETFKRIKDYVLALKQDGRSERMILTAPQLRARLERDKIAKGFTDQEMLTAVGHLAHHGYVSRLRTSKGEERILLAPDLLNNLASSIVLEARSNPRGLGALEERRLLGREYRLPELDDLPEGDRDVLLDSAVAMFLDRNVCFRQTDPLNAHVYLVFPGLINLRKPAVDDGQRVEEAVAYTVSGAVENVYASLVVLLGYSNAFARANQWHNEARYRVGDGRVCGFRREAEREGELDFVLYFDPSLAAPVRTMFQGLFESLLARPRLTVRRYEPVVCAQGHQVNRAVVREHLAEGIASAFCTRCGEKLPLPSADEPIALTRTQAAELDTQKETATGRARFEQVLFRLKTYVTQAGIAAPECFVSYAWGDAAQERWVEHDLATDLLKAGLTVILDRWENSRIGASVPRFVERVRAADRVIVVGTPRYRTKYDNGDPMRGFVVAAEGDLIGIRMLGTEMGKESVLPVLLEGEPDTALPPLLHGRVYADFRDPDSYFTSAFDLILSLYQLPHRHAAIEELRDLLAS